LQVVGFFKVAPDYPDDEIEKLIQIGGSSILYSASRDFVLTITSRGPWGPVFLPSVTFTKETEHKKSTPGERS
jgi:preprotein translocase subunit SecB